MKPSYHGGPNIAVKVPPHQFEQTVNFYNEVLGLKLHSRQANSVAFEFGANTLWIDRVEKLSRSEIWLEVQTSSTSAASKHLAAEGISRRDEIEALPADLDGFWVSDPASNIILVHKAEE